MSYDIYGEPLRRGHCEVHPHVHEEYPCSVCIQENKNRNSQQQSECDYYKIASLEHGLELSQQRIAELGQRNDELAATVEQLREQLSAMAAQHQCGCGHPACNRCRDDEDNREVLLATSSQLREQDYE